MHTKNIFSALAIVLCAILFIASALLLLVVSEGDGAIDPAYATLSATDEVKTLRTDSAGVDSLAFFVADEEHGGMHTLFKGLRPTVEIVGSDEDLIEISANASILEKVELIREGNTLVVQMREDCYKALENSEYSRGLYVECEVFTVKISGSIGKFATDAPVILDMNAADGIPDEFPNIENWYMAGHSLGGAMAASYAAGHTDELSGLILLGAYSTADLSDSSLSVLCLHGSEDMVMNREKHDECLDNLPAGYTEREIEGGCHAYFGMYGEQDGDGEPTLTEIEQITLTANYIADFILGGS